MRAVGRLVQEMCAETQAGWSWMLTLSRDAAPGWLAFHGPKGTRSGANEGDAPGTEAPRLELWPAGGGDQPLIAVPIAANRRLGDDLRRCRAQPEEPRAGWLLLLGLLHALDEAARARPRVPTVGSALTCSGAPSLGAWASTLTLGDLEAALLSSAAKR